MKRLRFFSIEVASKWWGKDLGLFYGSWPACFHWKMKISFSWCECAHLIFLFCIEQTWINYLSLISRKETTQESSLLIYDMIWWGDQSWIGDRKVSLERNRFLFNTGGACYRLQNYVNYVLDFFDYSLIWY